MMITIWLLLIILKLPLLPQLLISMEYIPLHYEKQPNSYPHLMPHQNRSESDEIIEIYVEDGKFKESAIFVHEPQIDLNRYDFGYLGEHELETKRENTERLCVDVVCLPMTNTDKTNELNVYAVIAGESDYLLRFVVVYHND